MPCAAQSQSQSGGFRVFELRQTPAAEVGALIERALSLEGAQAEVVVDGQRNRLLVRASHGVERRVGELIATFDRRQPVQRAVRANVESSPSTNVRTSYESAVEARSPAKKAPGQVPRPAPHAPSKQAAQPKTNDKTPWPYHEVQQLVARQPKRGGESVVETTAVELHHLAADKLPQRLQALLGARLSPLVTTNEDVSSFVVQLPGHTPLEIHVEKAAKKVVLRGPAESTQHCARLIQALDAEPAQDAQRTRVVSLRGPSSPYVQKALAAVATSGQTRATRPKTPPLLARMFQPKTNEDTADDALPPTDRTATPSEPGTDVAQPAEVMPEEEQDEHGALSGEVEIEQIPDLGAIIVRGSQRDVERVMQIIAEVERLSAETEPTIELYPLRHIGSEAMADVVEPLYDDELAPRQGRVSITPLIHPNTLLLIGRAESVRAVTDLIKRLDQPGGPTSQFEVFRLRHATAAAAANTLNQTFGSFNFGLGVRVRVTADARTNALIVQAGPRDLLEVRKLLKQLDSPSSAAVSEVRLFRLRFASAVDVAAILNAAVQPNQQQQGQPGQGGQFQQGGGQQRGQAAGQFQQQQQQQPQQAAGQPQQQQQPGAQPAGQQGAAQESKAVMLRLLTVDAQGRRQLSVGHLGAIRVSADVKSNTVIVSAPAESLDLIAALISQLDVANAVPAQIKVFTLTNGDATNMVMMLEDLFQISGTSLAVNGPAQGEMPQVTSEEGGPVPLRFSVDARTNSIIASGSASDLTVVEAILIRLDDSDVRERNTVVYRLKNAPALDVALAINEYLQKERQTQQTAPGLLSPFEKIEREVVVVPELVTNSLIVSATSRFFDEITRIVEQLDARSPMVMIQVLIAEVSLNNVDEFGVELGLQNSIMFDRSLLSGFQLITSTNQQQQNGSTIATTNQQIVGANDTPGFDFNNPTLQGAVPPTGSTATQGTFGIGLPNSGSTTSLNTASQLGQQALSNFGLGRVNNDLGYGGLVLSLSSDTVNFLLRALRERDRLDVLSRPQIMTLDNQPAYIVVGQRVPLLGSSTIGITGATTGVTYTPVGLIVAVTPRITPDGLVVMEIDAEKSLLGPINQGIPVGFGALGQVLRQPVINLTQAQTTISAMDGQTVVFGGMISQSSQVVQRRVPGLSEIPFLGRLFRYDYQNGKKSELLIIMTPHIVRNQADAERVKRMEAGRISWCLSDVRTIHGEAGLRGRSDDWLDKEIPTIYPDMDPTGASGGIVEPVPTPPGRPMRPGPRMPAGPSALPMPVTPRAPTDRTQAQPNQPALGPAAQRPAPRVPAGAPQAQNELRIRPSGPAPRVAAQPATAAVRAAPPISHRRQAQRSEVKQLQFESPATEGVP